MQIVKAMLIALATIIAVIAFLPLLPFLAAIAFTNNPGLIVMLVLLVAAMLVVPIATFASTMKARKHKADTQPKSASLPLHEVFRNEYIKFIAIATPGATITNRRGRFQIIGLDAEKNAGIPRDKIPWYGPYFRMIAYFNDGKRGSPGTPIECSALWYNIAPVNVRYVEEAHWWFNNARSEAATGT
jgi:hypothetical protein